MPQNQALVEQTVNERNCHEVADGVKAPRLAPLSFRSCVLRTGTGDTPSSLRFIGPDDPLTQVNPP